MRLWSIHPCYLDAKGLVALWREGLLAKKVLEGKTKGYTKHPQLERFRKTKNAVSAINYYLSEVFAEAEKREYNFNKNKISRNFSSVKIPVTAGQIKFEAAHLKKKLQHRNPTQFLKLSKIKKIKSHLLFQIVKGKIERWEKFNSHIL